MAYQVLARKYRPQRFADVAGQDHVTRTLMNALQQQRIAHGYIFSGHRGIGKTTIARILASALNCRNAIGSPERPTPEPCGVCDSCLEIRQGNAVDVIEIDAATNRGIDEIRELRDAARYAPARDRYKIYILDEAHQITDAAFNALLKTLEEPPDHVVFMMATTEPENIPQTIRSRCQHYSFHAVKFDDILTELRGIADREGVTADQPALALLAEAGDGSMRDALSIMDQAIASAPVLDGKPVLDSSQIRDLMGSVPNTVFEEILEAVSANQSAVVLTTAARLLDAGNSPAQIARQFVRYLRNVVVAKIANVTPEDDHSDLLQISPDERQRAARSAMLFTEEELTRFLQTMLRTFDDLGFRQEQRLHLELGLLKLVHLQRLLPIEELLSHFPTAAAPSASKLGSSTPSRTATSAPVTSTRHVERSGTSQPLSPRVEGSTAPTRTANPVAPSVPAAPASPSFSPFEADKNRKTINDASSARTPVASAAAPLQATQTAGALALAPEPVLVAAPEKIAAPVMELTDSLSGIDDAVTAVPVIEPVSEPVQELIEEEPLATAMSPEESSPAYTEPVEAIAQPIPDLPAPDEEAVPVTEAGSEAEQLQSAAVEALFATKGQTSAAEELAESICTIASGEFRVQTTRSKQILGTIFRPETEQIIRTALRAKNVTGLKLVLLPGTTASSAGAKKPRAARAGSAEQKAKEHPTVQAAMKLFNAEISKVFDLRKD